MTNPKGGAVRRLVAILTPNSRWRPFLWLWALFALWAIATPLFGGPDEPTHVVHIAAIAHGQLVGARAPGRPTAITRVTVPAAFARADDMYCWSFPGNINKTPNCARPLSGHGTVQLETYVGRYTPAYYLLMAPLARGVPPDVAVYLMRLLSAALNAALVAIAIRSALESRRPGVFLLGIAVALTPMTVFLAGVVNPNGVEITAAVAFWVTTIVVLDQVDAVPTTLLRRWTIVGLVLAVSRSVSPAWVLIVLVVCTIAFTRVRRVVRLLGTRQEWPTFLIVDGAILTGLWVIAMHSLAIVPTGSQVGSSAKQSDIIRLAIGRFPEQSLHQMIGVLQWLDTPVPELTFLIWMTCIAVVVVLAWFVADQRGRVALGVLISGIFLLPLVAELPNIRRFGYIWQGRYGLPVAVGLPILAAYLLSKSDVDFAELVWRPLIGLLMVGSLGAWLWAARRNSVGRDGPLVFFGSERWQPPVPEVVLFTIFVVLMALASVWCRNVATSRAP